jgi:hypothetical protein
MIGKILTALLVAVLAVTLAAVPDIKRYLRLRSM